MAHARKMDEPEIRAASARVFAIPELVESILEYAPALTLYRLRRVNSTFHHTIARQKCRAAMLLEPSDRLSLFRLTRLLQSPNLQRALRPFKIRIIHTTSGGKSLMIGFDTADLRSQKDIDCAMAKIESKALPCSQQEVSWRKIRLDRGSMGLELSLSDAPYSFLPYKKERYEPKDMTTVGAIVDEAIDWLRKHSGQEKRKDKETKAARLRGFRRSDGNRTGMRIEEEARVSN